MLLKLVNPFCLLVGQGKQPVGPHLASQAERETLEKLYQATVTSVFGGVSFSALAQPLGFLVSWQGPG